MCLLLFVILAFDLTSSDLSLLSTIERDRLGSRMHHIFSSHQLSLSPHIAMRVFSFAGRYASSNAADADASASEGASGAGASAGGAGGAGYQASKKRVDVAAIVNALRGVGGDVNVDAHSCVVRVDAEQGVEGGEQLALQDVPVSNIHSHM